MDRTLFQTIWPTFSGESREQLQALASGLLLLDRPGAERAPGFLGGLRRIAHTLKGSAGSIGLSDVERLVHCIEDALGADESVSFTSEAVGSLLRAIEAIEQLLDRVAQGGSDGIPELKRHVEAIRASCKAAPDSAPLPTMSLRSEEAPQRTTTFVSELWPVFRGEISEHLASLLRAVEQPGFHERAEGLEELRMLAANLQSSATALGAPELEDAASRVEVAFAGLMPGDRDLTSLHLALEALTQAVAAADAQEQPREAPPPQELAPTSERVLALFREEAARALTSLETGLTSLYAPSSTADRVRTVAELSHRIHQLKGTAASVGARACAELLERAESLTKRLETPGPEASAAAAQLAGLVLELEGSVQSFFAQAAPVQPARRADDPPAPGDRGVVAQRASVRVATDTLDQLIRQVDGLLLSGQRQERQSRTLLGLVAVLDEALLEHQRCLSELRHLGAEGAMKTLTHGVDRVREARRELALQARTTHREAEQLRLVGMAAREELRDLRTVAASTVLEPLRRTVREIAARLQREVELVIEGGEVRVDRRVLEEIKDPLLHLVRNAVDHGIESAEERQRAGKPGRGTLHVRAEQRATRVHFVISDDGAGLSLERIRATAVRRGLLTELNAAQLSDDETARLIFRAGFSTADRVTEISGRGVGMEVVQEVVTRLHGHISIESKPGQGTRFTLDLPLTLASGMFVLVSGAGTSCALPMDGVERTLRLTRGVIGTVAGKPVVTLNGEQLPFSSLAEVLGAPTATAGFEAGRTRQALVLSSGGERAVVEVDEIRGVQELVVQSLGKRLQRSAHLSGAATLDDGSLVAVLNPIELVRRTRASDRVAAQPERRRILVADDALTTRTAMKSVLDIAGYDVTAAADGAQALKLLAETPFDLLVTDVQMPNLDGLSLTRQIRADPSLARLPVLLVTSMEDPADRAAGMEAGADGYLVKREVERGALLELVQQLLPRGGR